jgi:secreted trypsin-like serine protease
MHEGCKTSEGVGLKHETGPETGRARFYLLALVLAMTLALVAAVPVFAQDAPPSDEPASGEDGETTDGGTVQPQVVGGNPVADGQYPFMVTVRDVTRGSSPRQQHFCGGTLIDANSVLTAAHCMEAQTPANLRVTVGKTVLSSGQGQSRSVTAIFRHPRYTSAAVSYRYDAAVLKLDRVVRNIRPVRIPAPRANAFENPGRNLTVAGWGNTVQQGPNGGQPDRYPNRMQEAEVPVVSDAEARRDYEANYAPGLMVAAGRLNRDTCQGDSGGPMFEKVGGTTYQVGITSFGTGCGTRQYPGVYTEANSPGIRGFILRSARR